jgi:hypothetical protein
VVHVAAGHPPLDVLGALHQAAAPLEAAGLSARLRVVIGSPAEGICEAARAPDVRWVVMGTRGSSGWNHDAAGSVARAVLACSPVPVIAVRPGRFREDLLGLAAGENPLRVVVLGDRDVALPNLWEVVNPFVWALGGRVDRAVGTGSRRGGAAAEGADLAILPFHTASEEALDGWLQALACPVAIIGSHA